MIYVAQPDVINVNQAKTILDSKFFTDCFQVLKNSVNGEPDDIN